MTFLQKVVATKDSITHDTDEKTFMSVSTTKARQSSKYGDIPIYYDGQDMAFASVSVLTWYKSNSHCYVEEIQFIYAKDITVLSKILSYLKLRLEEETKQDSDQRTDQISIYDFQPERTIEPSESLAKNFVYKSQVSPQKVFDYIFYDQKEQLYQLVQKFKDGTMYPKQITMDNKLGILLYGPPGTGKTGTISAIANMLQRNILTINFTKLTKRSQLDAILTQQFYSRLIYVFDEFDCLLDVLTSKQVKQPISEQKSKNIKWTEMLKATDGEEKKKIMEMMMKEFNESKQDDRIDLGYLLQKLDGLECANDRIIIATTNHPEFINPALLRPGRFDIKLELGNCSLQMYQDILRSYFNICNEVEIDVSSIPVGKWSPLHVINTCLSCSSLQQTIASLSVVCEDVEA